MIQEFCDRFIAARPELEKRYAAEPPGSYAAIFTDLVKILHDEDDYGTPDPERITAIDHGAYQGTILFIVAADGYQPSTYWSCAVHYGSCSGCDTFQAIQSDYSTYWWGEEDGPDEQRRAEAAKEFAQLALHMVQAMRKIGE